MPGVFDPVIWSDGDGLENIPNADDLNEEWRDSFLFLIGTARPIIFMNTSVGTTVTTSETNVGFDTEILKRGGMTHSTVTNNHQITVPYAGQYQGYMYPAFDTISTTAAKLTARLKKNGTNVAVCAMKTESTAWNIPCSFTVDCAANDVLHMTMQVSTGTAIMGTLTTRQPKIALWFAGEAS